MQETMFSSIKPPHTLIFRHTDFANSAIQVKASCPPSLLAHRACVTAGDGVGHEVSLGIHTCCSTS